MIKLNLGGGTNPLPGYIVVDRTIGKEVYPLDYPDGCADEVRASHVLEHFSHHQTLYVLREWIRVLRPGGILKIAVPNFDWLIDVYRSQANRQAGYQLYGGAMAAYSDSVTFNFQEQETRYLPMEALLMGGQEDDNDYHRALFTEWKLRGLMDAAGLVDIQPWTGDPDDCSSFPMSLNLMGYKPVRPAFEVAE